MKIRRIKKLVPWAIASLLMFGVAACEQGSEETGEEQIEQTDTEQTGEAAYGEEQAEPGAESEMDIEEETEFGEEEPDVGYESQEQDQGETGSQMESGGQTSEPMNQ